MFFELKLDADSDQDLSQLSQVVNQLEGEFFDEPYRQDEGFIQNPCCEGSTFDDFRQEMKMINEKVYKKVIKEGVGAEIDLESSKVRYKYAMFTESVNKPFDQQSSVICVREEIVPLLGCYLALDTMKLNEKSYFWLSSSVMFGKLGW